MYLKVKKIAHGSQDNENRWLTYYYGSKKLPNNEMLETR